MNAIFSSVLIKQIIMYFKAASLRKESAWTQWLVGLIAVCSTASTINLWSELD